MCFYWPNMGKYVGLIETQCEARHMATDREDIYAMFATEDWKSPFIQGVLPQKHSERNKLRKLVTCNFLHERILFKKGYDEDLLRCLGPKKVNEMLKEVHAGE